jgi:hypothetical protein
VSVEGVGDQFETVICGVVSAVGEQNASVGESRCWTVSGG